MQSRCQPFRLLTGEGVFSFINHSRNHTKSSKLATESYRSIMLNLMFFVSVSGWRSLPPHLPQSECTNDGNEQRIKSWPTDLSVRRGTHAVTDNHRTNILLLSHKKSTGSKTQGTDCLVNFLICTRHWKSTLFSDETDRRVGRTMVLLFSFPFFLHCSNGHSSFFSFLSISLPWKVSSPLLGLV